MRRIKGKDTKPEWAVRRMVHGLGYRYRLHVRALPGCPDLVFRPRKKVIFVHGCFWHGHHCRGGRNIPRGSKYWVQKLEENASRDRRHARKLRSAGWRVLVIWECQLKDLKKLASRIVSFLDL